MQTMRESWTDERLDDGFDRVDADLRSIRGQVSSLRTETMMRFDYLEDRFGKFEERFDRYEERFDRFDDKFDRWQRLTVSILGGLVIGLLALVGSHL